MRLLHLRCLDYGVNQRKALPNEKEIDPGISKTYKWSASSLSPVSVGARFIITGSVFCLN